MTITQADLDAAQADILDKVNTRFDALGRLVSPDPVPTPPVPPQTPQIRFADHRYYLSGPTPVADLYDLQAGQWLDLSKFPAAAPKYRYASTARVRNDTPGDTQLLPPSRLDGYLATSGGKPITRKGGNDQLLNLSSPTLIHAVVNYLPTLLKGFDGLYLDEVDDTWVWGYPDYATTDQWSNTVVWRTAVAGFVSTLANAVHGLGKKIWVNLGSNGSVSGLHVQNIANVVDGINVEYFVGRAKLNEPVMQGTELTGIIDRVSYLEKTNKKPVHVHVSTTIQSVTDYGFLAWLLGTEFLGSFTSSLDYGGDYVKPNPTLLTQAKLLGNPVGGYFVTSGNVLSRLFEGGSVNVYTTAINGSIALKSA